MLSIQELNVNIKNKVILNNLSMEVKYGEIHAIMGPNGSGKSTLSAIIAGKKDYNVISGKIIFKKLNLLELTPEARAGEGIFVSFQYPIEIPGVSNKLFLQTAVNAVRQYRKQLPLDHIASMDLIEDKISLLRISNNLLHRAVNVGFSGGEKKRNEILQMLVLEPLLCILDETDSGLDVDALKIVAYAINSLRNIERSFIIITHYQHILNYIKPDYVHILYDGHIIKSGDFSLVKYIEDNGYDWLAKKYKS